MKRFPTALAWFSFFVCAGSAFKVQPADPPKPFTGKVVSIADGDTITVLLNNVQHKVRLNGIDAPESTQAFGTKASGHVPRQPIEFPPCRQ